MPPGSWNVAATVTASQTSYSRTGDSGRVLVAAARSRPRARRRRILLFSGSVLGVMMLVLAIALVWPDGPPRGSIELVSVPPGATVRIDGTVLSKVTPIRIGDIDGRQPHQLSVMLRGFDTWENDVKFESGEREIRMQAILMPSVGTLDVTSTPPGAETIVNQRISGFTPIRVGDLPPNEDVKLELRMRGYVGVTRILKWNGKRALTISVALEHAR